MVVPSNTKVVFITGCSKGGIGFELCEKFAEAGCRVYASSRKVEKMEGFKHSGIRRLTVDVTNEEDVREAIDFIVEEEGKIDIVVSNAGTLCIGPITDVTDAQAAQAFDINVLALLRLSRAVVPHMVARKTGRIVAIGSIAGEFPSPFNGLYCASKAALHAVVETLSMELRPFNVEATLIIPGSVKSKIADNHSKVFLLPPNSLFKHYLDRIVARMFISQGEGAMPTTTFASYVVGKILQRNPPLYVRSGQWAWRFWLMSWLPRTWMLQFMARRIMGPTPRLG